MQKSERLNQELIFLSHRTEFHLADLMATFAISKRTALRDIAALENLGVVLYVDPGRYGGYRLAKRDLWVPVLFNGQEINALFFALRALRLLSATPFEKSYRAIYDKLLATLPADQRTNVARLQAVVHYYNVPNVTTPTHLSDLLEACLSDRVVTLQTPQQHQRYQVYDLLYRNGIWFYSGYNLDRAAWERHRCDQITGVILLDEVPPYTRADLPALQRHYEDHHHDIAFRCALTPTGRELVQKNRYPNMTLIREHDQDYLVGGYDYMVQYLLELGANVKVLAPSALRTGYLTELRRILDQYR